MTNEQKDKLETLILWGITVFAVVYFSTGLILFILKTNQV